MLTSSLPKSGGYSLSERRAEIESPKIHNEAIVLESGVLGRRTGVTLELSRLVGYIPACQTKEAERD